mgnify:CR=1 FL=1
MNEKEQIENLVQKVQAWVKVENAINGTKSISEPVVISTLVILLNRQMEIKEILRQYDGTNGDYVIRTIEALIEH